MSGVAVSGQNAIGTFIVPLRERHGRYRDFRRETGPIDPHFQTSLRALLERSRDQVVSLAEIGGRIYLTRLYVSAAEPGLAYVEIDGNRVPVDQPRSEPILQRAAAYVRDLQDKCRVSDALTPDTRVPLKSSFVAPTFLVSGPAESEVISWERLRDYARVVLVGGPGSGKTSCLRRLTLDITAGIPAPSDTLPILIQLRDFPIEGVTPEGITRLFDAYDLLDLDADLKAPLHAGRLLLMIDGLDELSGPEERDAFLRQLARLCHALPCVRVILTSRDAIHAANLNDFTHVQLLPFDNPKIEQWALDYLASQDLAIRRHEFVDSLRHDPDLSELVQNPLLLSLASSMQWKSPDELNDRAGFLRKCIDVLVQDWDAARGVARWRRSEVTSRQIKTLAGYLSARMAMTQRDEFNLDDLMAIVGETTEFRESARTLLLACQTSGLMRDTGDGNYCFVHRSFEDYFVASHLIRMTNDVQERIRIYSAERSERNFWALSCALASQADGLLEAAARAKVDEDSSGLAIMLAKALCQEMSVSKTVLDRCSALIVAALGRQLCNTELLGDELAKALQPDKRDRHIAWAGGVVGDGTRTALADFENAAELLQLIHRARSGVAREQLLLHLERSNLPVVRQVSAALRNDGWCTATITDADDQRILSVVVSRSEASETERLTASIVHHRASHDRHHAGRREAAQTLHPADEEIAGRVREQAAVLPAQETTTAEGDTILAEVQPSLPPPAPRNATARLAEDHVLIAWEPGPAARSEGLRYRVMRGVKLPPLSPYEYTSVVIDTEGHNVKDMDAPPGAELYYSIFAGRGAQTWSKPTVTQALVFAPEVVVVSVVTSATAVAVSWNAHRDACGVLVMRAEGGPPQGLDNGIAVEASLSGFIDTDVRPGTQYFYRIFGLYRRPDGHDHRSAGIVVSALPPAQPEPVRDLSAIRMPDGVRLTWLWPSDATEAVVRWAKGEHHYSRLAQDDAGEVTLAIGPEETSIEVCAIYSHSDGRVTAPAVPVRAPARGVLVTYQVRNAGLFRQRQRIIEFCSELATLLPALVIVLATGPNAPDNPREGEVVARVEPQPIAPDHPVTITVKLPNEPAWLACFIDPDSSDAHTQTVLLIPQSAEETRIR